MLLTGQESHLSSFTENPEVSDVKLENSKSILVSRQHLTVTP